ncbi:sulfotransferase family protein [Caulobacter endophyticus]|uniref:Sulfotransferase family protein n=1 Tax=Caulobacter endophyticus TaxID=2172652 RepID=A0A2T9JZL0_9CAUL|nr:hypothetical protein [Caulobacter endophyticus]PVM89172.1 hypothetical protein DDF67_12605 [Caulobacter endophyticus]
MSFHPLDFVYVHFAKAGGTSISKALADHYQERVFWDLEHDPCNAAHDVSDPPNLAENILAVQGHIRADRYAAHPVRVLTTFLRDPVDKLISVYFFWKTLPPTNSPDHLRFLAEKPSVLEHARATAGQAFPAYFGGFDMRDFDFIGFHDRRVEDLTTLSGMAGFPIPHEIHLNATPTSAERAAVLGDPGLLADLRKALAEDVDFYEQVRADRLGKGA